MKILVIAKSFIPPKGGGEISLLTLLRKLREDKKVEIYAICYGERNEEKEIEGYKIIYRNYKTASKFFPMLTFVNIIKWFFAIFKKVKLIKPDLIITQIAYTPLGVTIAKIFKIPVIVFLRSYEHFCMTIDFMNWQRCDRRCYKCLKGKQKFFYPLYFLKLLWHRLSLKIADRVISNTYYMKKLCYRWYKIDSDVIYPFIDLEQYRVSEKVPRYILYILPRKSKDKGYDIFLEVAKRLPECRFMLVGEKLENLPPNVEYKGYVKDMRQVYKYARCLLFPIANPGSFGRVAIEAMVNGIPVIYSNFEGLREPINGAGIPISEPYKVEEWIKAIRQLENKEIYDKLSKIAKKRALKFSLDATYSEFVRILDTIL